MASNGAEICTSDEMEMKKYPSRIRMSDEPQGIAKGIFAWWLIADPIPIT